jgi:hypothetical protein
MSLLTLPTDLITYIGEYLDLPSYLLIYRSCHPLHQRTQQLQMIMMTKYAEEHDLDPAVVIARSGQLSKLRITPDAFDEAAKYGQLELLKQLTQLGHHGTSKSLVHAIKYNYFDVVKYLEVNYACQDGLIAAFNSNNVDMLKHMLLSNDLDRDAFDDVNFPQATLTWFYSTRLNHWSAKDIISLMPVKFAAIGLIIEPTKFDEIKSLSSSSYMRSLISIAISNDITIILDFVYRLSSKSMIIYLLHQRNLKLNVVKWLVARQARVSFSSYMNNLKSIDDFRTYHTITKFEMTNDVLRLVVKSNQVEIVQWLNQQFQLDWIDLPLALKYRSFSIIDYWLIDHPQLLIEDLSKIIERLIDDGNIDAIRYLDGLGIKIEPTEIKVINQLKSEDQSYQLKSEDQSYQLKSEDQSYQWRRQIRDHFKWLDDHEFTLSTELIDIAIEAEIDKPLIARLLPDEINISTLGRAIRTQRLDIIELVYSRFDIDYYLADPGCIKINFLPLNTRPRLPVIKWLIEHKFKIDPRSPPFIDGLTEVDVLTYLRSVNHRPRLSSRNCNLYKCSSDVLTYFSSGAGNRGFMFDILSSTGALNLADILIKGDVTEKDLKTILDYGSLGVINYIKAKLPELKCDTIDISDGANSDDSADEIDDADE